MRFLADMGISRTVVNTLRERGHDAVHLAERGLQQLPDGEVIARAKQEDRVVMTHDLDFARLLANSGETKPSDVIFRLTDMRPGNVLTHIQSILIQFSEELEQGAIVTASDRLSRCRLLPIRAGE